MLAGPDEGGHAAEVARLVTDLGLNGSVAMVGAVAGERKAALYRRADLFVLPTFCGQVRNLRSHTLHAET